MQHEGVERGASVALAEVAGGESADEAVDAETAHGLIAEPEAGVGVAACAAADDAEMVGVLKILSKPLETRNWPSPSRLPWAETAAEVTPCCPPPGDHWGSTPQGNTTRSAPMARGCRRLCLMMNVRQSARVAGVRSFAIQAEATRVPSLFQPGHAE